LIINLQSLIELYGFVPTFHDAKVRWLSCDASSRKVIMYLEYIDTPEIQSVPSNQSLRTNVQITFEQVSTGHIRVPTDWLQNLRWIEDGLEINCEYVDQGTGLVSSWQCRSILFEIVEQPSMNLLSDINAEIIF